MPFAGQPVKSSTWTAVGDLSKLLRGLRRQLRPDASTEAASSTSNKFRNMKDWVKDEVSKGYAEERRRQTTVLFPVRLDDAVKETAEPWAVKLRDQRNIGDFRGWKDHDTYRRSLEKLLKWLKVEKGAGERTPAAPGE